VKIAASLPLAAFIRNRQVGIGLCLTFTKATLADGHYCFGKTQAI
jgi:hypothetical protein